MIENSLILLVDDEAPNLQVFGEALAKYHQIRIAPNGERALELAVKLPKPDLILLDIMMPGMDGFEVIEKLKADSETCDIPVIFLSALTDTINESHGLGLGAVDYITKPCDLSILLTRVSNHLELKKVRDWLKDQNAFLEKEVQRRQQEVQDIHLQLLQSEKLAAIGQLTAGIAHEINNPIGFISSNLNTLLSHIDVLFEVINSYENCIENNPQFAETIQPLLELKAQKDFSYICADIPNILQESQDGLNRVKGIVQDLKSFSHTDENTWETADLHKILDSILNIIWNELKYHCTVSKDYADLPMIRCLPGQIGQVFMNLLINAAQAIKTKGDVSISTGFDNHEVWVRISDTGEGIKPENLNRLFDPFFTTKPVGKGTGLGLAISLNIIKKHGGRIEVNSEVGKGTSFRVFLPIAS